jgi:hypothetical protein
VEETRERQLLFTLLVVVAVLLRLDRRRRRLARHRKFHLKETLSIKTDHLPTFLFRFKC